MSTKSSRKRFEQSKTQSNLLKWSVPFVLIVAALGIWIGLRASQPSPSLAQSGVNVNDVAPDFSVPTLDGNTFTLSEKRGNPTVIFFMAYWCGSCIPEGTALGQIIQEYGNKVSIVAINIDPSATWDTINQFKQAAGNGAFAWAWDTDQKVTTAYQVTALDTTLILDREGRVVYRDELPTQYETLKSELEKLTQ